MSCFLLALTVTVQIRMPKLLQSWSDIVLFIVISAKSTNFTTNTRYHESSELLVAPISPCSMLIGVCRQGITPEAMEALANINIKGNKNFSIWRNKVDKNYRNMLKTWWCWTLADCHALFCYAVTNPTRPSLGVMCDWNIWSRLQMISPRPA